MAKSYRVEGCFDLQVEADDTQEARTKAIRKLMGIATLTKEINFCIVSVMEDDR